MVKVLGTYAVVSSVLIFLNNPVVAEEAEAAIRDQSSVSLNCLVDPKSAVRRAARGDLIVDVRHKEAFEKYRIGGSINIPLHDVKSKHFWKSKALLLVGEGVGSRVLLDTCDELKTNGFKHVRVLHGGIGFWRKAGGTVEGQWAIAGPPDIESRELLQEYDPRNWAVILVSESQPSEVIEGAVTVRFEKLDVGLRAAVERLDREKRNGTIRPIIVIGAEDARIYPAIAELLEGIDAQLLYLRGGLPAHYEALRRQRAVLGKKHTC